MKMKKIITLKKWFIIKLLALSLYVGWLAAFFLWGVDYVYLGLVEKPTHEQEQLISQIESSRNELVNIPDVIVEREHQLEQAQILLASQQSRIPSTLNINDLVRNIIEIANECQVKSIPLRTVNPESITIGQYSYRYWRISMSVEGDFQNIANFVENIDGQYISTATVTSIDLRQGKETPNSSNTTNYTSAVTGTIELVVYSGY
ncbi:type 4a pilus biogenesis protein PilO [Chloroflexota bacterium]